jgi:hypothetical protein
MNRAERIERVLRRMATERIDTLVALSNAKHHLARVNLAAHLMGYRALGESALVLRADGATRLIVTAYIGIGNRLFIRGDGPGQTRAKGVPQQIVSIGTWRWETNDANGPIQFRLYKNDDLECAALGAQTLDPGHQQELTAAF